MAYVKKVKSNKLNAAESMHLCNLLNKEYATSGLNDIEFAKLASKTLGLPLNSLQIANRREDLGIPNNQAIVAEVRKRHTASLELIIVGLQAQLATINSRLAKLEGTKNGT